MEHDDGATERRSDDAGACVVVGAVARPHAGHLVGMAAVAVTSTMLTLLTWWSSEDGSGLFMVGIVMATPGVALAAPVLLLVGRLVTPGRRPEAGSPTCRSNTCSSII